MSRLDLANAYGSVNHGLLEFTLKHFHATSRFRNTVECDRHHTNSTQDRCSDPLSVVIEQYQQLGYTFSNSSRSITALQYADDTCLVAGGPSSCQKLLNYVDRWLEWTGMKAKVPKCHSLALQATSGKTYDPFFKVLLSLIILLATTQSSFSEPLSRFLQTTIE